MDDAKKKILIVDDSRTVRQLLKMILSRSLSYRISEAQDGLEALKALKAEPFDLVITDINMPNMDGLSLVQKVRNEMGLKIPMIIITTMGKEADRDKGLKLGANSYLTKPFQGPEVLKTATGLLG